MATIPRTPVDREIDYPTSDGKPMAETDLHRDRMIEVIAMLQDVFAADPQVYVSGNLLLFYERGDKRKHVAPDVFVVRGVPKLPRRDHYLVWQEGKGPDLIIELTSKTTRREDQKKKWTLYRDVLKVPEYVLFDPYEDYLKPPFQGYRLVQGQYVAIDPVEGRLPSAVLGLHLERDGTEPRFYDPATGQRLPTRQEALREQESALLEKEAVIRQQDAELQRLRAELEALRAGKKPKRR
ncbi:MAG TPA: Uma2 family endonuclease [Isosphaeraceae bacterium]